MMMVWSSGTNEGAWADLPREGFFSYLAGQSHHAVGYSCLVCPRVMCFIPSSCDTRLYCISCRVVVRSFPSEVLCCRLSPTFKLCASRDFVLCTWYQFNGKYDVAQWKYQVALGGIGGIEKNSAVGQEYESQPFWRRRRRRLSCTHVL